MSRKIITLSTKTTISTMITMSTTSNMITMGKKNYYFFLHPLLVMMMAMTITTMTATSQKVVPSKSTRSTRNTNTGYNT